jgi:aminopeptidase-like protein
MARRDRTNKSARLWTLEQSLSTAYLARSSKAASMVPFEYHTSADNLKFVHADRIGKSYRVHCRVIDTLENNLAYRNHFPYGEPQMGKRGVYRGMGDAEQVRQRAMLWVLSLSDARTSLLSIADRSGLEFDLVREVASVLVTCGFLKETESCDSG